MRRVFIPIRQMYYFKEKNMKRIKAACITQTIHFINKDITKSEYSKRKHRLDRERTKYKILSEEVEEDGSVFVQNILKEPI